MSLLYRDHHFAEFVLSCANVSAMCSEHLLLREIRLIVWFYKRIATAHSYQLQNALKLIAGDMSCLLKTKMLLVLLH